MLRGRFIENLVADFRSIPIDEGSSYSKETRSIATALESVIERYRIDKPRIEEVIVKHWDYIMGEKFASRCSPERIVRGSQLIILVSSTVLRQEMEFEKRQILSRLRQIPECQSITFVRLVSGS